MQIVTICCILQLSAQTDLNYGEARKLNPHEDILKRLLQTAGYLKLYNLNLIRIRTLSLKLALLIGY